MSQYIVLSQIKVQNANSIAGFTWGFPAITQFLGFTHALSRKISKRYEGQYETELSGCMVIANHVNNRVYQPKDYADYEFLQSKNPPVLARHKSASPPIIEEGKLSATVSLVIELTNSMLLTTEKLSEFESIIEEHVRSMRLAGGVVLGIDKVQLLSANTADDKTAQLARVKRLCMPGFVLQDRSSYLAEHSQALIDEGKDQAGFSAWLDFAALKMVASPKNNDSSVELTEHVEANWDYQKKPFDGYLIPLMTGYKAISQEYAAGEVEDVRDINTPARFVEAVHSVGEWQSLHRVNDIESCTWHYAQENDWYLCQQSKNHTAQNSGNNNVNTELFNNLFS